MYVGYDERWLLVKVKHKPKMKNASNTKKKIIITNKVNENLTWKRKTETGNYIIACVTNYIHKVKAKIEHNKQKKNNNITWFFIF